MTPPATTIVLSAGAVSRTPAATAASTDSVTITRAWQSSTRNASSAGVRRKFTGTAMAPSMVAASADSTNSGRFSIKIITRSPTPTPRRLSASASAATRRRSSAQVMVRPANRTAGASGCISACRSIWLTQFCRRAR